MNHLLHLPYREGNSTVIFDARIRDAQKLSRRQRKLGLFFSVLAFVGLLSLGSPIIISELSYRLYRSNRIQEVQVISQRKTFGDLLLNDPFTIIIPKINLTASILANINPANESSYLPAGAT